MNNSKYILLIALIGISMSVIAQQAPPKDRAQFQSTIQVGLLEGEKGSAFQLQTINGLLYKKWFAGFGIGLDYYRIRSIPIFLDIRKNFSIAHNSFFAYVDGGFHYPWITDAQKDFYGSTYSNGFYSDLGFGYRLTIHRNSALLLSIGYSYKQTQESISAVSCPFYGPCYPAPQKIDYNLNRLNLKFGLAL